MSKMESARFSLYFDDPKLKIGVARIAADRKLSQNHVICRAIEEYIARQKTHKS